MENRKRSEMNRDFMWDLTPIYAGDEAWRAALSESEASVKALSALPGTLKTSAESLRAGLDKIYAVSEQAERVYAYAMLRKSEDGGDPAAQEMEARALSMLVALQTATAFVNPEILSIDGATLGNWLKGDVLKPYRHIIGDIARARAHTLDRNSERLMAMLGDAAQTPESVFEMLSEVDMRFPAIHDENDNELPLTHASFGIYRESRSQQVRRAAFETYFGEYAKYINTLAATYAGSVKLDCFDPREPL